MRNGFVAIIDDDEAVRLSTASLLTRAGFAVRLFDCGDRFLAVASTGMFSCILLDMRMPGRNGLAVLRALGARGDSPPVVVVTAHGEIETAVEAMKLGARDFIEKPYDAKELLVSIESARRSHNRANGDGIDRSEAAALVAGLSGRQRQVLQGIVRGLQNKIIAYELDLSVRTVEAYRAQLLHRLGCRGTADAVRVAIAAGFPDQSQAGRRSRSASNQAAGSILHAP